MTAFRTLAALAGGLILLSPVLAGLPEDAGSAVEQKRQGPEIVWATKRSALPLFVPRAEILTPDGKLQHRWFLPRAVEDLNTKIRLAKKRDLSAAPSCDEYRSRVVADPPPPPPGASDTGTGHQIPPPGVVLSGRVLSISPGMRVQDLSPANLVTIQVEHVFANGSGVSLARGGALRYITYGGSLTVDGVDLCSHFAWERTPLLGERLLISGWIDPRNPSLVYPDEPYGTLAIDTSSSVLIPAASETLPSRKIGLSKVGDSLGILMSYRRAKRGGL